MSSLGQPQGDYDCHPTHYHLLTGAHSCGVGETGPGVASPTMEQEGAWQEGHAGGKWPVHLSVSFLSVEPMGRWGQYLFRLYIPSTYEGSTPQFLVKVFWVEARKGRLGVEYEEAQEVQMMLF